jgi:NADH-quinone oxidoreductase subunit A
MPESYLPILLLGVVAVALGGAMLGLAKVLGPKQPSTTKGLPFECGSPPIGSARERFSVKYYVTAILFLVFDIESVFVYPWAVLFRKLGWFGFVEMLTFTAFLLVGLVYVLRKGALEWE